mmetsp:Transcript_23929/g.68480  ORF Transcript_23929/g.68480 Transcript_23929/m.68480 type:complete len:356 (-) Transcript_23929:12-1079(-)
MRRADELQVVAQPLHCPARTRHAALQRIGGLRLRPQAEADGCEEPVRGGHRLAPHVDEREAACAIGDLRLAGVQATLTQKCCMLISKRAADRQPVQVPVAPHVPVDLRVGADLRQREDGHSDLPAHGLVPLLLLDVHQHVARGVGDISQVHASLPAAREPVDQPRLDGAKTTTSMGRGRLDSLIVVHHPLHLHSREVCGHRQARPLPEPVLATGVAEILCRLGRAQIQPDQGLAEWLARLRVPGHSGLALVGDADAGHVALLGPRLLQHVPAALQHAGEDLQGVVLAPARMGIVLLELDLVHGHDMPAVVEEHGSARRRAVVDGQHVLRPPGPRAGQPAPATCRHFRPAAAPQRS